MSVWMKLGWFVALLLAVTGCETTRQRVRPPEMPEEMIAPPENDPRYTQPMEYPDGILHQPLPRTKSGPVQPGGGPMRSGPAGFGGTRGMAGGY